MTAEYFKNKNTLPGSMRFFCVSVFLILPFFLGAQEVSLEEIPGLRDRAVVMRCTSRIVEQNQQVVWDMESANVTIPGRPVGIRLVGTDLVVVVQFTPFFQSGNRFILVAHGQTWINVPNEGMSYHTTIQTIPVELREQVYFFPLGSKDATDEARIEIQIVLEPYDRSLPSIRNNNRRPAPVRRNDSE